MVDKTTEKASVGSVNSTQLLCDKCNKLMHWDKNLGTSATLVGFWSPPGHDHNDNCNIRIYECENGHRKTISKQNKCPNCDWTGKKNCFCHEGEKLEEWPGA